MSGTLPWVNAATALRRVCGVVALLGLFAMHGLDVPGAAHAGHVDGPMPAVGAVAGHEPRAGQAAMTDTGESPSDVQERAPDRELSGVAGLCLAALLAGVVAVVLLSRLVRLPRCTDPATARGWPIRSRRHRDPCLFALSIQRC